jgi:hypothetical protein
MMKYAILFSIFAFPVFAHSGGLDRNGCHNDNINGGYHCHRDYNDSEVAHSNDNDLEQLLMGIVAVGVISAAIAPQPEPAYHQPTFQACVVKEVEYTHTRVYVSVIDTCAGHILDQYSYNR